MDCGVRGGLYGRESGRIKFRDSVIVVARKTARDLNRTGNERQTRITRFDNIYPKNINKNNQHHLWTYNIDLSRKNRQRISKNLSDKIRLDLGITTRLMCITEVKV